MFHATRLKSSREALLGDMVRAPDTKFAEAAPLLLRALYIK